jgi:hypothetical protein
MEQRMDKEVRVEDGPTERRQLLTMGKWRMWHRSMLVV